MIAQAIERIKSTLRSSVLDESATKQGVVLKLLSLAGLSKFRINVRVSDQQECHLLGSPWYQTTLLPPFSERASSVDSQLSGTFSPYSCGPPSPG